MNKGKKPSAKSAAKSRKPSVKKEPIRDLNLSERESRQVKGGQSGYITQRKAGGGPLE